MLEDPALIETKCWFLKMSRTLQTVICARVSPSQKAGVVKMIKEDDPSVVTLAIGDGANDVSMILQADIGIGIFGKEGHRAVDSSDYAIAEFRFLWQLIFKHGRWNYKRISVLLNYYFYKNFVYTFLQVLYASANGYSMQSIFPDSFMTLYNMILTALPIGFYAWLEKDVYPIKEMDGEEYRDFIPSLYFPGQRNLHYNIYVSILWLFVGLFQAVVLFVLPSLAYERAIMIPSGDAADLQILGITVFTSLMFVVNNKLFINH